MTIQTATWKTDWIQFMISIMYAILTYLLVPFTFYTVVTEEFSVLLNFYTFMSVFIVLFIIRIFRLLNRPPKYRKVDKIVS